MPRGKALTELEKGLIQGMLAHPDGELSNREIARRIGRSECVRHFRADLSNYGQNKAGGRPKALSERKVRNIQRMASNSTMTLTEIKAAGNLSVSRMTIQRALARCENIVLQKMKPCPRLKQHHKTARLEFCKKNMVQNWSKVSILTSFIFSYLIGKFILR